MAKQLSFPTQEQNEFFVTLHKRVNQYFRDNNISKTANGYMVFKTVFYLGGWAGIYLLIILGQFQNIPLMLGLAALLGFFSACVGLNVSHDSIHGAYSSSDTVNRYLGYSFNLIGANAYMWNIMHNIVHHTYTNIPGYDEDIESVPFFVRTSPKQEKRWWHKYQHFYALGLYSFASLSWVFIKDYAKFFSDWIGGYDNRKKPKSVLARMVGFKLLYYTLFLVLPMIVLPFAWWQVLIGFMVMHLVAGFTLAIVFMLAHVVEGPDFPDPDEDGEMNRSWARHQMWTTANFACDSPIVHFLFGGLNFQIEHHLFPHICHIHYRNIYPIVKKTAKEFGVPYFENQTMGGAVMSHLRYLKEMGRVEEEKRPTTVAA